MGIVPDYGDTPLSGDERDSLRPRVAELLGANPDKAALYDLEQAIRQAPKPGLFGLIHPTSLA